MKLTLPLEIHQNESVWCGNIGQPALPEMRSHRQKENVIFKNCSNNYVLEASVSSKYCIYIYVLLQRNNASTLLQRTVG